MSDEKDMSWDIISIQSDIRPKLGYTTLSDILFGGHDEVI